MIDGGKVTRMPQRTGQSTAFLSKFRTYDAYRVQTDEVTINDAITSKYRKNPPKHVSLTWFL